MNAEAKNDESDGVFHLYLHVRHPPLITIAKFERVVNENVVKLDPVELRSHNGDRFVHWLSPQPNSTVGYFRDDVSAVANAPYVKLVLSKKAVSEASSINCKFLLAAFSLARVRT